MTGRAARQAARAARVASALAAGALWWWAVLRLAFAPHPGLLEGAVAAGGWGLSLLPVHCVPRKRPAVGAAVGTEVGSEIGSEVRSAGGQPGSAG